MNEEKKKKLIIFLGLLAIEIVMLFSGVGVISNGSLSITILHIPVILGTIILGLYEGVILGGCFGIGTMIIASSYGVETIDHLFINPILSVVPRVLIAIVAYLTYRAMKNMIDDHTISSECIASAGAAFMGTITNTVLVTLFLGIMYPQMLGTSNGMAAFMRALTNIIGANTSLEICISILITSIIIFLLKKNKYKEQEAIQRPIRKNFQKWLILVMIGGFLLTMISSYLLQTMQAQKNAEVSLENAVLRVEEDVKLESTYDYDEWQFNTNGIVVLEKDGKIIEAANPALIDRDIEKLGFTGENLSKKTFSIVVSGSTYYCKASKVNDMTVVAMLPGDEIFAVRNETAIMLLMVNILIFLVIFILISKLLQKNVVEHIYHVNKSLSAIQSGDLDELVEVRNNEEFSILSDGINATVNALKDTMQEVATKINQEMEFAREIQLSALPAKGSVTPKFHEYEIDGMMDAAKEVGGDFYDYFFIGDQKLAIVIADVSGKGVPSALFMMTAKTLIKNFVLSGKSPAKSLELANTQLCENNEAGMFVTVWLGILDYGKGTLTFANAGHNPPLLKKQSHSFEYMDHKKYKRSIMLGMREGVKYIDNEIAFEKGDILYLYTDGVTEANNLNEDLYGEARLLESVENHHDKEPEDFIKAVRDDIDTFVGQAEQFDDITMVVLKMCVKWENITLEVNYENTKVAAEFIESNIPENCSKKAFNHIAVAFDEIYSNVVKYSKASEIEIKMAILDDMVYLIFTDDGIPYNPLESGEPDLNLPIEERSIGGLGVFLVKKTMDYVDYQYKNKKNVFAIGKKII